MITLTDRDSGKEFSFMADLPVREKSRVVKVWEQFQKLKQIERERGSIVSPGFAAKLLDVSKQRVSQLLQRGRLERVDVDGHPFVTEASIVQYAKEERKGGRPRKLDTRDMWRLSVGAVKEMTRKAS